MAAVMLEDSLMKNMLSAGHSLSSQDIFKQLTGFSSRPGLEITPVTINSALSCASSNVPSKIIAKREKKLKITKEQMDIKALLLQLPSLRESYNIHKKIGEGTYSTVYLATYKYASDKLRYAVKHLTQNFSLSRIQKELKFMQMIGGQDNVVNVFHCLKSAKEDCVVFVMPYLEHRRFSEYVLFMDADELRLYMKNLLIALRRVHSFNVIHRDVKPGNFLYNRETKEFLLVDFGLAQQVETSSREKRTSSNSDYMPIDYSKRKRSGTDESTPLAKITALSPLRSRENIMIEGVKRMVDRTPPQLPSADFRNSRVSVERTPLKTKSQTSSSGKSSSSRKKLFNDDSTLSGSSLSSKSHRRGASLGTSLLKSKTENKLATTPSDQSTPKDSRSFTPLVSDKTPTGSFVQVRNSQVVAQKQARCSCTGSGAICNPCQGKRALAAPRAGTPGFRPPEVLLKHFHQTTAVDMWAVGVVMLCVLSGCYPFFKAPTDLAALIEIMTIFGSEALTNVASKFGRRVISSNIKKPLDLRQMCRRLRSRRVYPNTAKPSSGAKKCMDCNQLVTATGCLCLKKDNTNSVNGDSSDDVFPDSAYDLLLRLLDLDPTSRITAEEALNHPFIVNSY